MGKPRANLERVYGPLYTKVDSTYCSYCGDHADVLDHVPPLTWVGSMGTEYFRSKEIPLLLMPACAECNGLLGSIGIFDMEERRAFISAELKSRYRSLLTAVGIVDRSTEIRRSIVASRIAFANSNFDIAAYNLSDATDEDEDEPSPEQLAAESEELWEKYRPKKACEIEAPKRKYVFREYAPRTKRSVKVVNKPVEKKKPFNLFDTLFKIELAKLKAQKDGQK